MIRPFDLKYNNEILIESDEAPQLLKDATFYLGKKFGKTSKKDFKKWLEERRDKGYMEPDIEELKDDVYRGEFKFLMPVVDKLPNSVSSIIDMLLEENKMLKEEKIRK